MTRIFRFLLAVLVFSCGMTGFAESEKIDNSVYQSWSKFKVGTTVKYSQEKGDPGNVTPMGEMVFTLIELTPDKAVVEQKQEVAMNGKKVWLPPTKKEYLAKVDKTVTTVGSISKKSEEEIEVPAGKFLCSIRETENTCGDLVVISKVWSNEGVPGLIVKSTNVVEKPVRSILNVTMTALQVP